MSKPWIWLRIASVFDGLFAVGHGLGHERSIEGGLPGETVVGAMKTFHFNAMGSDRTYWDFFTGYSLMVVVIAVLLAVVLWQLASLAKSHALKIRPLVRTLTVAQVAITIIAFTKFLCCSRDRQYPGLRVPGHGGLRQ
jgi:ABC-type sugar transport system permease subunit